MEDRDLFLEVFSKPGKIGAALGDSSHGGLRMGTIACTRGRRKLNSSFAQEPTLP